MPVFDFNNKPDKNSHGECTYTMLFSNASEATAESPILLLDNQSRQWKHHSCGVFTNPVKRTSFEFEEEDGKVSADILTDGCSFCQSAPLAGRKSHHCASVWCEHGRMAMRYIKSVRLRSAAVRNLSAEDGFLQFMMERLFASNAPTEANDEEEQEEEGDSMKLTSLQSITDFMNCAGRTLPDNIRLWARRNLAVARSHEVSAEERRHAQRALVHYDEHSAGRVIILKQLIRRRHVGSWMKNSMVWSV